MKLGPCGCAWDSAAAPCGDRFDESGQGLEGEALERATAFYEHCRDADLAVVIDPSAGPATMINTATVDGPLNDPDLSNNTNSDVVVIGDGAVTQARDELLRRLRQEGMLPEVLEIDSTDCADVAAHLHDAPKVVLSFADWSRCDSDWGAPRVEQPVPPEGGMRPIGSNVRPAAPLFTGSDYEPCRWWGLALRHI